MDKRLKWLFPCCIALSATAGAEESVPGPPDNVLLTPEVFRAIDVDGNGRLSAAELHRQAVIIITLSENFAQADQNADGAIDAAEFSALEIVPEPPNGSAQEPGEGADDKAAPPDM